MNFIKERFQSLLDVSAWMLILIGVVGIAITSWTLALTLFQFSLVTCVIAGVAIIVSRVVFPQINLAELVNEAKTTPLGAAIVAFSIIVFCIALVFAGAIVGIGG